MKIAIDGIAVSHPQPGGYRTYTTNLVNHLALVDSSNQYLLFVDRPTEVRFGANWHVEIIPAPGGGPTVVWREQIALPRHATRHHVTLLHSPCATGPLLAAVPLVATVYDTIEFTEPLPSPRKAKLWVMRVYSRSVQARIVRKARLVITLSEHSRRRIMHRFGLSSDGVAVTHAAPSPAFKPIDPRFARGASLRRHGASDHVLAFASLAPRKNIPTLMRAYASLDRDLRAKHPLALICTHSQIRSRLQMLAAELGLEQTVLFVEQASDNDLLLLFNAAALFVFPSLEEGFGLPPLEAMACGTPVVASNTSSLPEILGDAALLAPPMDVEAIAQAMRQVLVTPGLANELREHGLQRCRTFSWERTARQTLAAYERAVEPILKERAEST